MTKDQKSRFTPSWRRELLAPFINCLPLSLILISQPLQNTPWVTPMLMAAFLGYFVMLSLREDMVMTALKLNRTHASPTPPTEPTRFHRVMDRILPGGSTNAIQKQLFLPEITTAPA